MYLYFMFGIIIVGIITTIILLYMNYIKLIQFDLKNSKKFLINLDKRIDRLSITSKLLNEFGYDFTRYSAIDSLLKWDDVKDLVDSNSMLPIINNYRTQHHELSKEAVGCYLSHYNLWKDLKKSNEPYYIIFEDDTLPTITFDDLQKKLNIVPENWDIILFGGLYHRNKKVKGTNLCHIKRFYCLHAYMISKKGAEKLQNLLPIKQQIDSELSDLSIAGKLNIYGLTDNSWIQNPMVNSTDIQTKIV